jgi:phosphatidyl-myo-inositol dimannoside synthase
MKVLVLAPPLAKAGGIQRYTLTLLRALKEVLGEQNVRCLAMPESSGRNAGSRFSALTKLRFAVHALWQAARWQPDLIVCAHLALGPIGWIIATLGQRPYWIMVYGIEAWGELPELKSNVLRQANRVVVISDFSRKQVVSRHQIDDKRIWNLPCTLDETLMSAKPAEPAAFAKIPSGQRMVMTVARMAASERYKGHDEVLRALPSVVEKIPNLTYMVVGDGDDRSRLEALAKELELARHVVFTGEVTDAELAALYNRSEVFLLPAKTVMDQHHPKGEGFGIVYLEAMAFGKPVIGPNYGAPAEIIRDGQHGYLVDPENSGAVAEALLDLLNHPEKAREMGKAGSNWVRENYSYSSFREKLREMLPGVAATGQGANMDKASPEPSTTNPLFQALFVLWVVVVNLLYFHQYKDLLFVRFAHLLHRWH